MKQQIENAILEAIGENKKSDEKEEFDSCYNIAIRFHNGLLQSIREGAPQLAEKIVGMVVKKIEWEKIDIPYLAPTEEVRDDVKINKGIEIAIISLKS